MFLSIINRTILTELLKIFALSLLGITGLLLMAGIIAEASQQGLGPMQILAVIPLIVPSTLPYTIPATTLFAACVVYGRLAADNEILAIKSAGINILQVIWPAIFVGMVMSLVTMGLYYSLIPTTHYMMRSMFLKDVRTLIYTMLKKDGTFSHPKVDYVMYVKKVQDDKLIDAQFMHKDPKDPTRFDIVARAKEAELLVDPAKHQLLVRMRHCYISGDRNGENAYVEEKVWPVDLPKDFDKYPKTRGTDMTWPELLDKRKEYLAELEHLETERAMQQSRLGWANTPDGLAQHVDNLHGACKHKKQELRSIDVEMHMRPSLALGCFCFVLVGCPVGIWFSRSDYLSAFITCFLPIVFVYYPLMLCSLNLAKNGSVSLGLAIWTANGLMVLVALELYRRLLKY